MTKKTNTKKTKSRSAKLDCLPLTRFRNRIANSSAKVTPKELKEGSELRGFSELPIADIRLVTELMSGLDIVPARRKNKPSRIECLDYITKTKIEAKDADPDSPSSRDERHDTISYPSSDDTESE